MEGNKSQHTDAAQGVRVLQPKRGGGWLAQPTHTAKSFSTVHSHVCVCQSVCLSVCLSPLSPQGLFQLYAAEVKPPPPPPAWLHPHSPPDSICTHLQRAALIIERGERGGEPAYCLCMNQGHWKIKDCSGIIAECSCGIIPARPRLTKPCLLYIMALLWDDCC